MNVTDLVVLVVSLWGQTAEGEWKYIGNQYVQQQPIPLPDCSALTAAKTWKKIDNNPSYKIQLACYYAGEKND